MAVNDKPISFGYDASGTPQYVLYDGSYYFYLTNLQGDVTAIVNTTGETVVEYSYDAWGNVLETTGTLAETLGKLNPLRYRGYVYDRETGLHYLQSRYYDPQIGRFINADGYTSTGQGFVGNNMFAYCGNNSVNYSDPSGFLMVAREDISPYGGAGFALAMGLSKTGEYLQKSQANLAKKENKKYSRGYTVYFLEDDSHVVQYVGRVTDVGYPARMAYHLKTKNLTPQYTVSGLRYDVARGLEEIGMIQCHTLNALGPKNNKIHGIGLHNPSAELYMRAAIDYLFNKAEGTLLNMLERG